MHDCKSIHPNSHIKTKRMNNDHEKADFWANVKKLVFQNVRVFGVWLYEYGGQMFRAYDVLFGCSDHEAGGH